MDVRTADAVRPSGPRCDGLQIVCGAARRKG